MRIDFTTYISSAFVIGLVASAITIPLIISFCQKYGYYDQPNIRKVHHTAVPRLGGLVFLPSMAIAFATTMLAYHDQTETPLRLHLSSAVMVLGAACIYTIGLVDDIKNLSAMVKFVFMLIASSLMPLCHLLITDIHGLFGIHELPIWLAYGITVLTIMTIVNAVNLIDGIDGLASGYAIIVLAILINRFLDLRAPTFTLLGASLAGSVLAFFLFNVFGHIGRRKIFMGDAGSLILGYVMAYLGIKYLILSEGDIYVHGNPLLVPYSLFIVPVFDLVRVALTRIIAGQPMFQADKRHIHHILIDIGLTMHQTLATILMMVIVFIIANLVLQECGLGITAIFFIDVAAFAFFIITLRIIRRSKTAHA